MISLFWNSPSNHKNHWELKVTTRSWTRTVSCDELDWHFIHTGTVLRNGTQVSESSLDECSHLFEADQVYCTDLERSSLVLTHNLFSMMIIWSNEKDSFWLAGQPLAVNITDRPKTSSVFEHVLTRSTVFTTTWLRTRGRSALCRPWPACCHTVLRSNGCGQIGQDWLSECGRWMKALAYCCGRRRTRRRRSRPQLSSPLHVSHPCGHMP